jgi:hypothetical protein
MVKIAASQTTDGPAGDLQRPLGELFGSSVQAAARENLLRRWRAAGLHGGESIAGALAHAISTHPTTQMITASKEGTVSITVLAAHVLAHTDAADALTHVLSGERQVGLADQWCWSTNPGDVESADDEQPLRGVDIGDAEFVVAVRPGSVAVLHSEAWPTVKLQSFDPAVSHHRVEVGATRLVAECHEPAVTSRPSLLAGAMLGGIARATLDLAVSHAKQREAFGQPIGAFQAIKHTCADMALRLDATRALTRLAAVELDAGRPALTRTSAAKVVAADAAIGNARAAIQILGGMGFTAEAGIGRYLRRAHFLCTLFGDPAWHCDQLVGVRRESSRERIDGAAR